MFEFLFTLSILECIFLDYIFVPGDLILYFNSMKEVLLCAADSREQQWKNSACADPIFVFKEN